MESIWRKEFEMTVQTLKKWGNSPAVRLPATVMEAAHLTLNQQVEIQVENGRVIISPAAPQVILDQLVAAMTPENRHKSIDFGAPVGLEIL
jgi:antitoxin MazE